MSKIGRYRRRVTFIRTGERQDESGAIVTEPVDVPGLANVPAAIKPLSAREYIAAAAPRAVGTTRIEVPFLEGVDASMSVRDDMGKVYGIVQILPDDESGRDHITLVCDDAEVRA